MLTVNLFSIGAPHIHILGMIQLVLSANANSEFQGQFSNLQYSEVRTEEGRGAAAPNISGGGAMPPNVSIYSQ